MPGEASLLFIIGGGDADDRIAQAGSRIVVAGITDLTKLLVDEPHDRLHVTRNFFRQSRQPDLSGYRTIVNLITEPEQSEKVLDNVRKVLRGVSGRVINPPEAVLRSTRDQVARRLKGISGLIVPAAVRLRGGKAAVAARTIETAGIGLPLILRETGTHGGKITGRFDQIEKAVGAMEEAREHIATQFVDFASADGLYRKYRVFFIGPRIILRHMLVSDDWNVHAKSRAGFMAERPKVVAEERALMESDEPFAPNVQQVLEAVRGRMDLDFFGMDFAITQAGEVVLFEANATMSFFPFSRDPQFEYLQRCFEPVQSAFRELLGLPSQATSAVRVRLESA